nr:MAG TPA: hypothetical protein [Caudoviricetes sp.]
MFSSISIGSLKPNSSIELAICLICFFVCILALFLYSISSDILILSLFNHCSHPFFTK